MNRSIALVRSAPLLVATALLGACPPAGPKLATLDAKQATQVDLILVGGGDSFCVHGDAPQLKAVVTLADGKKLETWSFNSSRDGKLPFDQFEWGSSYGAVDPQGQLTVGRDPFALMDLEIAVKVRVVDRPELTDEVRVMPTFDCGGVVDVRGSGGQHGLDGAHGRAGRPGQSGDSSRAATDGESGGHGQDGGNAGRGDAAPDVVVAVGYVTSKTRGRLVMVRVGQGSYWLVDPRAGKRVVVVAQGGAGGSGGHGGHGGSGGSGGSNNIEGGGDGGHGGDGGDGGRGGNGADGGEGGFVSVYYDARYEELRDLVAVLNDGGDGGRAGGGGYAGNAGVGGSSASGKRGASGRQGVAGQPGVPGRAGPSGPAPEYRPAPREQLFSAEIAAGLPID